MSSLETGRGAMASRLMRRVPAVVLVLLGISFFQFGAVLATDLFDRVGPACAALLRLGFAGAIMTAIWYPLPRRLSRPQLGTVVCFGLVLGSMNLAFYEALERIPLGTTISIQFAGPLTVAVLGRRRVLDLLWVALAATGILALVAPNGSADDSLGYLLAALAGAGWAGYIVFSARLGAVFSDSRGLALGMLVACLVPLLPGLLSLPDARFSAGVLAIAVLVAVFSSVIPHTFDTEALRRLPPHVFGVLMSLEPAFASAFGALFLAQYPSLREGVGVLLVVVAAIGVLRYRETLPEHA